MKKLCIVSGESVFGGTAKSGVAEMTDSLANALAREYDVTVVCPDGQGILTKFPGNMRAFGDSARTCKVFGVRYYLVRRSSWPEAGWSIADGLEPDILHVLAAPSGYTRLTKRPGRMICTFDRITAGEAESLSAYDGVRTVSPHYAAELLSAGGKLAETLAGLADFGGTCCGIATPGYAPEKGLLISAKFSAKDQAGKETCKAKLCKLYGIPAEKILFLMLCRLDTEHGADQVLDCLETVREGGGFALLVGEAGNAELAERLGKLKREDGALWIQEGQNVLKAVPLLAGADFYLCPSVTEPCGLVPMQASRYGTVPLVSQVGGLADNFSAENAIVLENGLADGIARALALYGDKTGLEKLRAAAMEQDFSWSKRKAEYVRLYEGTA